MGLRTAELLRVWKIPEAIIYPNVVIFFKERIVKEFVPPILSSAIPAREVAYLRQILLEFIAQKVDFKLWVLGRHIRQNPVFGSSNEDGVFTVHYHVDERSLCRQDI